MGRRSLSVRHQFFKDSFRSNGWSKFIEKKNIVNFTLITSLQTIFNKKIRIVISESIFLSKDPLPPLFMRT